MPALCHQFLANGEMTVKFTETMAEVIKEGYIMTDTGKFCSEYIETFNTGIHFSFFASVAAMLISLIIFVTTKKRFPQPAKKEQANVVSYTPEEKQ